MKDRNVTIGLLNGFYKMVMEGDYDLITDNIMKCPQKVADPMARAILSYGYLASDKAYGVLMKTFEIYKNNFCEITTEEEMFNVFREAEKIKDSFKTEEEQEYASRMLRAFTDEIELAYKESANTKTSAE